MKTSHGLARVAVSFDETNLAPHAGLLPAAALAQRLGLAGLIDQRLGLASEAANSGTKALTVIGSILAGGDSIDASTRLVTDSFELLEASAPTPGPALIAAGTWLNERHGTTEERIVESIAWHVPVESTDG